MLMQLPQGRAALLPLLPMEAQRMKRHHPYHCGNPAEGCKIEYQGKTIAWMKAECGCEVCNYWTDHKLFKLD